jgi:prepilin-type processing-associated H-X9-DG protein
MKFIKIITIIAVLIILSVFLIIAIGNNQRCCDCVSRRATCNSNLKQIGVGLMMYAQDNDNYFSQGDNITGLKKLIPLLNQTQVLICPKDKKRTAGKKNVLQESNSSYIYLDIERKLTEVKYPSVTVVAFDKPDNNHSDVNILYIDGHVSKIKMVKNYNCEDILAAVYKGDFSDPIREFQLKKVRLMDKKFVWEPERNIMEIIYWILTGALIFLGIALVYMYKKSRKLLTIPIYFSPIWLSYVLNETFMNKAYPPEADCIIIPFFEYLFFFYPIAIYLASKVETGELSKPVIKFWNTQRNTLSLFSLILSIFPLGLFWYTFATIAVRSNSFGSLFICILMMFVTVAVRTYAIQDKKEVKQPDGSIDTYSNENKESENDRKN